MQESIDRGFIDAVRALAPAAARRDPDAPLRDGTRLTGRRALELWESQLRSRHVDLAARFLRSRGQGFHTIGSSGHEGTAALAAALRIDDTCFLHYRGGAFYVERARARPEERAVWSMLLGICASREDPIAGGRHKVIGSKALRIPPQTSTIASQMPKAVGMAFALELRRRLGLPAGGDAPAANAIVLCTFGDASVNHSTAVGALNAACHTAFQHLAVPILFVCEDNGIGISVPTPPGFIEATYGHKPGLRYFDADGCDLADAHDASLDAVAFVRETRRPAFLHLRVVRLMGHGGADVELAYRSAREIREAEERDPVRQSARLLVESGLLTPDEALERYEAVRAEVLALAEEALKRPRLRDAADVMAPIAPRRPSAVAAAASREPDRDARARFFGEKLPEEAGPMTLSGHINAALGDLLAAEPRLLVFGEDVGRKGGVYGVTKGLVKRAGVTRVFDTLLDEQSILGLAIGAAHAGLVPVPEIQYLAYLHNAIDQLRGEAATLQFFSQGQYRNGLVVRIAGYGYQKGFGGHFHNDNAVAALRDIPGLVIATPSRPEDAAAMLRTCAAAAEVDGSVCVFLEPIALYNTRDLHAEGDGGWLAPYEPRGHVPIGSARVHGEGRDLLMVTFANGLPMCLRVARRLRSSGISVRILDLRWLAPLPVDDLLREANAVGRVLVCDETRRTGGVSEAVVTALTDAGFAGPVARVASEDSFVPLGDAAYHVLLSEETIERAARALAGARARAV
jgi:2-oxoisovalerate dehydrogenase E1 component